MDMKPQFHEKASYKSNVDQMCVCAAGLDGVGVECQDNCW